MQHMSASISRLFFVVVVVVVVEKNDAVVCGRLLGFFPTTFSGTTVGFSTVKELQSMPDCCRFGIALGCMSRQSAVVSGESITV